MMNEFLFHYSSPEIDRFIIVTAGNELEARKFADLNVFYKLVRQFFITDICVFLEPEIVWEWEIDHPYCEHCS